MPKKPSSPPSNASSSSAGNAQLKSTPPHKLAKDVLASWRLRLFAWCSGLLVMLGLWKFGTPIILEDQVEAPKDLIEWLFFPWPMQTAYFLFVIWGVSAARALPFRVQSKWSKWLWLPLAWLGWQFLSAFFTVDQVLTKTVLAHFMTLVGLFYGGYALLSRHTQLKGVRGFILLGLVFTMWTGTEQKFGGLQATREMIYQQPYWQQTYSEAFLQKAMQDQDWLQRIRRDTDLLTHAATTYGFTDSLRFEGEGQSPLERDLAFLEKIGKDRVFGTLFYPNALAAAIWLLLPLSTLTVWSLSSRLQKPSRFLIAACLVFWALACVYWSGSKGGWLVGMITVCFIFLLSKAPKGIKIALMLAILITGSLGFAWKYQDYFQSGATSVSARVEYWKAGWQTSLQHPVLGTGPGTFMRAFSKVKPDGAEMTRLTHNDYLQQASDTGWPAAIAFLTWIAGSLIILRPKQLGQYPIREAIWLGVCALSLQNFIEFGLYIPAIAWPQFLLLGWLWGTQPGQDQKKAPV